MGAGRGFWWVCLFLSVLVGFVGTLCCGVERLFVCLFVFFPSIFGLLFGSSWLCSLWAMCGPCCVLGAQEF